jgi:hypothetical protein
MGIYVVSSELYKCLLLSGNFSSFLAEPKTGKYSYIDFKSYIESMELRPFLRCCLVA